MSGKLKSCRSSLFQELGEEFTFLGVERRVYLIMKGGELLLLSAIVATCLPACCFTFGKLKTATHIYVCVWRVSSTHVACGVAWLVASLDMWLLTFPHIWLWSLVTCGVSSHVASTHMWRLLTCGVNSHVASHTWRVHTYRLHTRDSHVAWTHMWRVHMWLGLTYIACSDTWLEQEDWYWQHFQAYKIFQSELGMWQYRPTLMIG